MQNSSSIESYLSSLDLNWHDLIESLPVGVIFFNDKWEVKSFNKNFIEFFNGIINENDLKNLNLFSTNPLTAKLPLKDILSLKSGRYFEKEISFISSGGKSQLLFKGSPIFIEGIFKGGVLIVEDFNVFRINSSILKSAESSVVKFLDILALSYIITDTDGKIAQVSDVFRSKFENLEISEGKNLTDLFSTETNSDIRNILNEINEDHEIKYLDIVLQVGNTRFQFHSAFIPGKEDSRIYVILREIGTRRNDIIHFLSDSRELMEYEAFAKVSSDGFFRVSLHGIITYWSDNAADLFGVEKETVLSKFLGEIFPEVNQNYFESIRTLILSKGEWKGYLSSDLIDAKDLLEVKIVSEIYNNVKDLYIFCNRINKSEQNLRIAEKEERFFFKDAVSKSNEMILQLSPSGKIQYANEKFCKVLLYNLDEIRGKNITDLIEPNFRKEYSISDIESLINLKKIDFLHIRSSSSEVIEVCFDINLSAEKGELKHLTIYFRECSKQDQLFLKTAHSLLYQFPEPVAIIHNNLIIKVNPKFLTLFGSEYETEFYKKPLAEIVSDNSKGDFINFINDYSVRDFDSYIYFLNADSQEIRARLVKIYSSADYSYTVVVIRPAEDLEEKEYDVSKTIKEHFNHIGPYFWSGTVSEGKIVLDHIDQEFLRKIGYSDEETFNLSEFWDNIVHPADLERFYLGISELKNIESDKTNEINYRVINKNSDVVWISNTIKSVTDINTNTIKVYGSITDATDWLSEREELKSIIDELDKLNNAKEKFISIISHDLKSPFTSIVGFAELILSDSNLSKEDIIGFVSHIKEASLHTVDLLNSLLDLTKLQTGRIEVEPKIINAGFLVNKTIEILSGLAYQKGIKLISNIDRKFYITADDNLILQVFNNLVANSIKFTPAGGTIEISARKLHGQQKIEFCVKDTGVGIEKEDIDKLFVVDKKFTTLGTDGERGTGLGLSLVHEIIEKHNGKIRVNSEVGKGSEFIFSLPISAPSILVLDSVESERTLYCKLLQTITDSIEIIPVSDEEEAIEIIHDKMPMLIIFEHNLSKMNGDDFIGELAKAELIYQPSLFVLTKSYTKELHDSYKDIGVNEVFSKPFELQKFKSKLDKYIGKLD